MITHVVDTALWVAHIRAMESKRARAAFHDPLAALLAGEAGEAIARSIPHSSVVSWGVAIRTSAIDRLIGDALRLGIDTVVNLGAGFDTRPYRMDIPSHVRWFEIDFPQLVDSKNRRLAPHTPACAVERIGMDLLDRASRNALLARIADASKGVLVISEGVIPYISNHEIACLAKDLHAIAAFRFWIQDFDNAGVRAKTPRSWADKFKAAPFLFQVDDWFDFFSQCGWEARTVITSAEEAERIHKPFPLTFPLGLLMYSLPKSLRRKVQSASGAVMMRRPSDAVRTGRATR